MKQFTVAAVNGGMIGHRCAKAAQQDIARLCRGQGHPVKAGDRHIVQIQVLTVAPPVILTLKIRHINSRQMVCIPEQRVTVRHPVLKAPSCQMWHTAEFMNFPPADQPPGQCTFLSAAAGQPRSARAAHRDDCGPVPQSPPASLPAASLPVQYENTPPALQRYSHKGYTAPPSGVLTTKPHDSAGTHRRACARIADSVCVIGFTAKVC